MTGLFFPHTAEQSGQMTSHQPRGWRPGVAQVQYPGPVYPGVHCPLLHTPGTPLLPTVTNSLGYVTQMQEQEEYSGQGSVLP